VVRMRSAFPAMTFLPARHCVVLNSLTVLAEDASGGYIYKI
jgi:hypothetical protein